MNISLLQRCRLDASHLIALSLLISGCDARTLPQAFTSLDSAGVTLAVSRGSVWEDRPDETWTLGPTPRVDLAESGAGVAHEFYRVQAATRLSDGRIVVADAGSSQIRVFSEDGRSLAVVGREGEGPGEYRQISSVHGLAGDSLAVFSWPTRVSILAPDFSLARTFSLGDFAWGLQTLDGQLLAELAYPSVYEYEGESRLIRVPVPVVRFSMDGVLIDTIALTEGYEEFMVVDEDGASGVRPLFGKDAAVAARGATVVVGSGDRMEFEVLDEDGSLNMIVRVDGYPLEVSDEEVEAERAALLGPESPAFWREIVSMLPAPDSRPAYGDLLIDSDGYFWAGEFQSRRTLDQPRRWEVFEPEGRWLGSLQTPARFTVFEIGSEYILGRIYDALDVEHVQVLDLHRGS